MSQHNFTYDVYNRLPDESELKHVAVVNCNRIADCKRDLQRVRELVQRYDNRVASGFVTTAMAKDGVISFIDLRALHVILRMVPQTTLPLL